MQKNNKFQTYKKLLIFLRKNLKKTPVITGFILVIMSFSKLGVFLCVIFWGVSGVFC